MKSEIITIGDELLIGQVIDTNSAWLAMQLNNLGIDVYQITSVSDNASHIKSAITEATNRVDLVITTGGLGPTKDDITKHTLCELYGAKLVINQEVLADVERFILARGGVVNERNRKQAEVPNNCKVIRNPIGTAPCLWFDTGGAVLVVLPGVPHEMKAIFEQKLIPQLQPKLAAKAIFIKHKTIHTSGLPESQLADLLHDCETNLPACIKLAYLPSPGFIRLRMTIKADDEEQANSLLAQELTKLEALLGNLIYGYDDDSIELVVGRLLRKLNKTMATAESCTGGKIAHLITSISGSSDYFEGGVVAYSNSIKSNVLGVDKNLIQRNGAVSCEVVEAMAAGVRRVFNTDYAVATSGVAGPNGGSEAKPVGTTWIAVASEKNIISVKYLFGDDRLTNIAKASVFALNMLRKLIISENTGVPQE